MKYLTYLIILFLCGFVFGLSAQVEPSGSVIVLDRPGFPFTFDLNPGDSVNISRMYAGKSVKRVIKLISVKTFLENNYWFPDTLIRKNYYQADVEVELSGKRVILHHRQYQMPKTVDGLRIYIENIREWDEHGDLGRTGQMKKMVRISVTLENETWGPGYIVFPVNNYIWRAAVYNNTWSGLVPFNLLYYHRGEDYGAIPDLLEVVSPFSGKVSATPLPGGDGNSNYIEIENNDSIKFLFAHMNIESIDKKVTLGSLTEAGWVIGRTGMTWDGRKSQHLDPHLHVGISVSGMDVATFPYLMEAYLRKFKDPAVAIAGGYRSALPGEKVELDGTRSFAADNSTLKNISWNLSDGTIVNEPITSISYSQPGIYSEELTVETAGGNQDKDFLYVIVYDTTKTRNIAYGWAYYYPIRDIHPGDEILFWNRLTGTTSDVLINYGDDQSWIPAQEASFHIFKKPGVYVVTLKSTCPGNGPVNLKMAVNVEN